MQKNETVSTWRSKTTIEHAKRQSWPQYLHISIKMLRGYDPETAMVAVNWYLVASVINSHHQL